MRKPFKKSLEKCVEVIKISCNYEVLSITSCPSTQVVAI